MSIKKIMNTFFQPFFVLLTNLADLKSFMASSGGGGVSSLPGVIPEGGGKFPLLWVPGRGDDSLLPGGVPGGDRALLFPSTPWGGGRELNRLTRAME